MQQVSLLAEAGYRVSLASLSSDDMETSRLKRLAAGLGLAIDEPTAKPPPNFLSNIDVLHVHNTFPRISMRWLIQNSKPFVMSVHNYRAFCANGLFLRQGHRCLDCVHHGIRHAVTHGCYQDSRLKTLPVAAHQRGRWTLLKALDASSRVVVPGEPMRLMLSRLGVKNTITIPNPIRDLPDAGGSRVRSDSWTIVSRLSPEKGVLDLVQIWPADVRLSIIGDGPEREEIEKVVANRRLPVHFRGSLDNNVAKQVIQQSIGLVFSSKALEGSPSVYGEAMAAGTPIAASEGSMLTEQVILDGTGSVFDLASASSLRNALHHVSDNRQNLSSACRDIYTSRYRPSVWTKQVSDLYQSITSH